MFLASHEGLRRRIWVTFCALVGILEIRVLHVVCIVGLY